MGSAQTIIAYAGLSNRYWSEGVATAAYVKNWILSTAIIEAQMPYEQWHSREPNVGHLKVFGCIAYAHIPDQQRQNLDKKLKSCDLLAMIRNPKVTD